jgi:uncharacterized protein YhfF
MWRRVDGKRTIGFAQAGPLRDELTALVVVGTKTATTGFWRLDYEPEGEQIETVGERLIVLDSADRPVGTIEVTRVESHRFVGVPWELARDEGGGFTSTEDYRARLRRYYDGQGIAIADDDLVICVWFKLVE